MFQLMSIHFYDRVDERIEFKSTFDKLINLWKTALESNETQLLRK